MGWASAGNIFDPVAQVLIDCGAPDDLKTRALGKLIDTLRDGDWDTCEESLEGFEHDPAVVQAFRDNGIVLHCNVNKGALWCEKEKSHDGDHWDSSGDMWPAEERTEGTTP
jgi:hypothetical protein